MTSCSRILQSSLLKFPTSIHSQALSSLLPPHTLLHRPRRDMNTSIPAVAESSVTPTRPKPTFIDIGANLTDPVFRGRYHGKRAHDDDFDDMMRRAREAGVTAQMITGGSLQESKEALELCVSDDLVCTIGCHPTRTSEFEKHPQGPAGYLADLTKLLQANARTNVSKGKGRAVAIGECGLDYDRLHFAPAHTQKKHFASQLSLAVQFRLPLFLHSRAAAEDFADIIRPRIAEISEALGAGVGLPPALPADLEEKHGSGSPALRVGVVHSFTGSMEEMKQLVEMGFFVSINGCGMKTQENLEVLKALPLDRLLLETDCPWCEPRASHASSGIIRKFQELHPELAPLYSPPAVKHEKHNKDKMVKGRNEPCMIGNIAGVIARLKGVDVYTLAEICERNTRWLFQI